MQTPFTVDDLYLHIKATELDFAPNGTEVACTFRSVDRDKDDYRYAIWRVPLDGGPAVQLTRGAGGTDNSPHWSPDGAALAFVSNRSGTAQIHLLARSGGEAMQIGQFEGGASDFVWSPDGKGMAVASGVTVGPDLRGARPAGAPKKRVCAAEVAWKLPYKSNGVGYLLAGDRQFAAFVCCKGQLVYSVETPVQPTELWTSAMQKPAERQLTDMNPWFRERTQIRSEVRLFAVPDGKGGTESIEGWLLRSADAKGAAPLLNDVHGGPSSYALLDYDTNVFWQALCSQGCQLLTFLSPCVDIHA